MSGKFGKFAAVAVAATAVMTLAGTPASAADTAYNTREVWLDGAPWQGQEDACVTRSMYLTSGNYMWKQLFQGYSWNDRVLYLAEGTYTWEDCIHPQQGYYEQWGTLSKPGSETAILYDGTPLRRPRGSYDFGSSLIPQF